MTNDGNNSGGNNSNSNNSSNNNSAPPRPSGFQSRPPGQFTPSQGNRPYQSSSTGGGYQGSNPRPGYQGQSSGGGYQGSNPRPPYQGGGQGGYAPRPYNNNQPAGAAPAAGQPGTGTFTPRPPYQGGGGQGGFTPRPPGAGGFAPRPAGGFTPRPGGFQPRPGGFNGPRPGGGGFGRPGGGYRGKYQQEETHKINERIFAQEVRVVKESGEQLGILPTYQAMQIAEEEGLDLVEISPNAQPPVCKIMDYGKFKYKEQKKESEAKKNRNENVLKELRLRYCTGEGDLDRMLKQAREFLGEGDKVKFVMRYKGREVQYHNLGQAKFNEIVDALKDIGSVDERSPAQGRMVHLCLAPLKSSPVAVKPAAAAPKPVAKVEVPIKPALQVEIKK